MSAPVRRRRRGALTGATVLVLLVAVLAAVGGAVGVERLTRGDEGTTVVAEFADARGLVVDADVLIAGAKAGRTSSIELTRRGTARVTMRLHDGLEPPRSDAKAAIRPADLLGDVVLDLSPGAARTPLRGAIPVARTVNAPRLEQVLETFDEPVRDGLRALFVEGGRALAGRGADLARTLVALRPAVTAADGVLGELDSQQASLESVVADAARATRGLAASSAEGERALVGLQRRLSTVAARRAPLRAGLRGLPDALARVRGTTGALTTTVDRVTPLADELRALTPGLSTANARLRPFMRQASRSSTELRPALAALRGTLGDGRGTFTALTQGLRGLRTAAPDLDAAAAAFEEAAPAISKGFFVNFADQGAEPGRQPLDVFADPARNYWRGAAVFSCEAFGVPIEPGCMAKAFGAP
ncbi:MlaD family protein [Patulibacter sp.]|uniref:MlaD family protein n=1 Tax=Patulibacter sp. TaxID=1912859 RepID=UPI00271692DB|nr:MlaD family protein [Patulibacter sp.]MDO9409650.1 MlaD family protein [Patulibacter sp.]